MNVCFLNRPSSMWTGIVNLVHNSIPSTYPNAWNIVEKWVNTNKSEQLRTDPDQVKQSERKDCEKCMWWEQYFWILKGDPKQAFLDLKVSFLSANCTLAYIHHWLKHVQKG